MKLLINILIIIGILLVGCKKKKVYTSNERVVKFGHHLHIGDTLRLTEGVLFSREPAYNSAYKKINDTLYEVIYRKPDRVQ